jgi:acetyl esterase/lipase
MHRARALPGPASILTCSPTRHGFLTSAIDHLGMRKTLVSIVVVLVAAAACTAPPVDVNGSAPTDVRCTATTTRDIPYTEIAGVDPALLSLDVHPAPGVCRGTAAPVVVWVHGGGWAAGDKANLDAKVEWAADHGWTLVSVNYRLSPREPTDDPSRVMHPDPVDEVASALTWIADHIDEFGGDADGLALLGHSAGGHLVSRLSVDPTYLAHAGAPTDLVDCTVALDTEGYDLQARSDDGEVTAAMIHNAFGDDPAVLRGASPLYQISAEAPLPRFLLVTRGTADRRAMAARFRDALVRAGGQAQLVTATGYSHADVNERLGDPSDTQVTPPVTGLLRSCLSR